MIRLTIARYYTPTGRSIQSAYNKGYDEYMKNFFKRYSDGEMVSPDSVHFADSLKFKTLIGKRTVYGGGGIMPDVFVGVDTAYYSDYYRALVRKNIFNAYVLEYADKNRKNILSGYKTFDDFKNRFKFSPEEIQAFIKKGEEAGIKFNEAQYKISEKEILMILRALVAGNIWQTNEQFRILNEDDPLIDKALKLVSDREAYNRVLGLK
jgi:carboxyl-terminal processing protease